MAASWCRVWLGLVAQAAAVGAAVALAAVLFRWLILWCTLAFTGQAGYGSHGRASGDHWPWLGGWFPLLAPVLVGAVYGPLTAWLVREDSRVRLRQANYRVDTGDRPAGVGQAMVKALAAVLCIGGGGSVGRTGPIVQVGAAFGGGFARLAGMRPERMRLLIAAGAAGGLAASFHAPLAGACFALEIVLNTLAADAFAAALSAALSAAAVSGLLLGDTRWFHAIDLPAAGAANCVLYAVTGVVTGLAGAGFSTLLHTMVRGGDVLWRNRAEWARPIAGGAVLGALLVTVPPLYGVGVPVIAAGVDGRYAVGVLVVLMLGKMLATGLTLGIGGYGGVFMPTLFVGAMGGEALGELLSRLLPDLAGSPGNYAVIGMSAALIGATRAPVTGIVLLLELTGDYDMALPLMIAAVPAVAVSMLRSTRSPYIGMLLRSIPASVVLDSDRRDARSGR
ncbi:chloride channel protein [Nocardia sp. NPDC020380]|uniref:chloride channel protein n=1 Tax=Nocardia sp. NPDC020380 TaxID=3364309 RepID=UPI0037BB676D